MARRIAGVGEALLRALFVEDRSLPAAASSLGMRPSAASSLLHRFLGGDPARAGIGREHPTLDEIAFYVTGRRDISMRRRRVVALHLARCAACAAARDRTREAIFRLWDEE